MVFVRQLFVQRYHQGQATRDRVINMNANLLGFVLIDIGLLVLLAMGMIEDFGMFLILGAVGIGLAWGYEMATKNGSLPPIFVPERESGE
jgi:1,4-dihydroxy-2-naphthoate octaprenyltransferase